MGSFDKVSSVLCQCIFTSWVRDTWRNCLKIIVSVVNVRVIFYNNWYYKNNYLRNKKKHKPEKAYDGNNKAENAGNSPVCHSQQLFSSA